MKGTSIIIKKELKRVFSDRKLIMSLFVLPAIIVIAIYSIMGQMINSVSNDIEEHVSNVYIVNCNTTTDNMIKATGYSSTANITRLSESEYASQKAELEEWVLNGSVDLIVYFDRDFESKIATYSKAGDPIPDVRISYNSTENYSSRAYSVFSSMVLSPMRDSLIAARLGNVEMLTVFSTSDNLIVKEEKANSEFISMMLPYLIVMMLFAGAMGVGVDAIAGEKERGTLASMLLTPVNRTDIVTGKLVSMAILSSLSAVVYAVSMIIALTVAGDSMGGITEGFGSVSFGVTQVVQLLVVMLTLVYLYVAIIGLLATLSKDTKTASTMISPLYIVVIILGMITMFTSGKTVETIKYAIPVYGSAMAIKDICSNSLEWINFACAAVSPIVLAALITVGVAKAFDNEKIMFNA